MSSWSEYRDTARSRGALEEMKAQDEWDPYHGLKLRYVKPVDGGFAMPTMAQHLQLLLSLCQGDQGCLTAAREGRASRAERQEAGWS